MEEADSGLQQGQDMEANYGGVLAIGELPKLLLSSLVDEKYTIVLPLSMQHLGGLLIHLQRLKGLLSVEYLDLVTDIPNFQLSGSCN